MQSSNIADQDQIAWLYRREGRLVGFGFLPILLVLAAFYHLPAAIYFVLWGVLFIYRSLAVAFSPRLRAAIPYEAAAWVPAIFAAGAFQAGQFFAGALTVMGAVIYLFVALAFERRRFLSGQHCVDADWAPILFSVGSAMVFA